MQTPNNLTIVIPVLNEPQDAIFSTLHEIRLWLNNVHVIFVDDHSDNNDTLNSFTQILNSSENVEVIVNEGIGQEEALYTGINHAKTSYIACIDCDGQDPMSVLRVMYETITSKNVLAVAGVRKTRDDSIFRIIAAKIYHYCFKTVFRKNIPAISNFFIIHKDLIPKLNPNYIRGAVYLDTNACYIPYIRQSRQYGNSRFTLFKLLKVARNGLRFARKEKIK